MGTIRLIWDACSGTRNKRATTHKDIMNDIHVKDFNDVKDVVKCLLELTEYDESDLEDEEFESDWDLCEYLIDCLSDINDGSPNILYFAVNGRKLDGFEYDEIESLNLNQPDSKKLEKEIKKRLNDN